MQQFIGNTQYDREGAALRRAGKVLRTTAKQPGKPDAAPEQQTAACEVAATILNTLKEDDPPTKKKNGPLDDVLDTYFGDVGPNVIIRYDAP